MMRKTILVLLLAISWPIRAEQPLPANPVAVANQPPQLTVANIDPKTEILPNPGLAVDKTSQVLPPQAKPVQNLTTAEPATLVENERPISDPTQMTGSFSQALSRIHGQPGQNSAGAAAAPAAFPSITLAAKAIRQHHNKSAMLNVADKIYMVKQGGKFSFMENNLLYEIQVNKIENDFVDITVLPMGRQMTLQ